MNINGEQFIDAICVHLKDQGKTCHDYQILAELKKLDRYQLNQLITFGDVDVWINERNKRKNS